MELKVIHYSKDARFILRPIIIKNHFTKPIGGLWTCPTNSDNDWVEWCNTTKQYIPGTTKVELNLETDHLLVINNDKDKKKMKLMLFKTMVGYIKGNRFYTKTFYQRPDFELMKNNGIDAIWIKIPECIYGWDCESVLILNERCVKSYETIPLLK